MNAYQEYECIYIDGFLSDIEYRLGKCYYEGNGVETDWFTSKEYLSEAFDGYKDRGRDPYNYVEKRINEIEELLSICESALPRD